MLKRIVRKGPDILRPFVSSNDYKIYERRLIEEKSQNNEITYLSSMSEVFA